MGNEVCCQQYTNDQFKNQKLVPSYLKQQNKSHIQKIPEEVNPQSSKTQQLQPEIDLPKLNQKVHKVWIQKQPFKSQLQKTLPVSKRRLFAKDIYQGEFDQIGRPHGLGKMYKQDGSLFIGQFISGYAEGPCFYILKNGSYYSGSMKKNTAQTQNGYYHSDQLQYNGGFKSNLFDGKGIQKGLNGYSFDGTYKQAKKIFGILKWGVQPDNYIYSGSFDSNGQFTGKGKLQQPNGKYEGDFLNGKKHGKGLYCYQHKLRYEGQYVGGERQGSGTIYNCDNTIAYKGQFKGGLPNGKGVALDSTGRQFQTEWIDGVDKRILN